MARNCESRRELVSVAGLYVWFVSHDELKGLDIWGCDEDDGEEEM